MKKCIFALSFLSLSFVASADPSSLWCAFTTNNLTPQGASQFGITPYMSAQVDVLNDSTIQIDVTDNYGNSSRVIKAKSVSSSSLSSDGIQVGTYQTSTSEFISIKKDETTYTLTISNTKFYCDSF